MNITKHNTNAEISAPGAEYITGAGGGKGGSGARPAVEAENTLRSAAVARIVEVVSEGPIEGLAGGARGIYINDSPFQNPDLTYNFPRAEWDYRIGLPSQDYMAGFSAVESEIAVNSAVTIVSNNIARTVTSALIDTVKVTILLPQGLSSQNTTNGDLNGSEVTFRLETRLAAGTWASVGTYTISGKTTTSYEAQYRINRPAGAGLWEVRVVRESADPPAAVRNQTTFARLTEIQDIKVSYPDAAVVGIAIDAESVGNSIPRRAYLVKGMLIQIPSNYNPVTRVYTGVWNGVFVNSTIAVDNPAWVMYDALTNTRYGAGIPAIDIDRFSFYDAAVYCDANVTFTPPGGSATNQPRYTFNARIADRPDMMKVLKAIAGSMAANLIYWNGKWTVIQDRPTSVSKLVTKSNTIRESGFTYKSSSLQERHTAFNVSFNDREDRHLERVVTVEDTAGIARYGYNPIDIAAFGCTTEGQAIRTGKWALDTELNQTEIVEFEMSLNGFDLMPGDVVSIYDEDYANNTGAGRIVSVAGTSVVLDTPCIITTGSSISVLLADGVTIQTRNITQTAGTLSTVTIASAFTTAVFAQADFVITSAIAPRAFRIIDVTVPEKDIVRVMAVVYDGGKFNRVESGINLPALVFTNANRTVITAPTDIVFTEEAQRLPNGINARFLNISWTPAAGTASFLVYWSRNNGEQSVITITNNSVTIPTDADGLYTFNIYARDFSNRLAAFPLFGEYLFDSTNPAGTIGTLGAVSSFQVVGGGTTWVGRDLAIQWVPNAANTGTATDYRIDVFTTSDVLLRSEIVTSQSYEYTLAMNIADGGARNAVKIRVTPRDATSRSGVSNTLTFTNSATAVVVSNLTVVGGGTTFANLDLDVTWVATLGLVQFENTPDFKYYRVEVMSGATVLRTANTTSRAFTYTFAQNIQDNGASTPLASIVIRVTAINQLEQASASLSATFTPAAPPTPTAIQVFGAGGTTFNTSDLPVQFTCTLNGTPFANTNLFKEYRIEVLVNSVVRRTVITLDSTYTYFIDQNTADNTTPSRNVTIRVSAISVYNVVGSAASTAFTNPTPSVPANIQVVGGFGSVKVTFDRPAEPDVEGTLVWGSTTNNFTPSASNLLADVSASYVSITGLPSGTTYYIRIAAYDIFGKSLSAAGLNLSGQSTVATVAPPGVPASATAPASPTAGDVYVNTVDGKLYRFFGGVWTSVTAATDISGTLTTTQIGNNTITTGKLAAAAVTANELAANSVIAGKIAAGTITGDRIAATTITGDRLVANTITADKIAAGTITAASGVIAVAAIDTLQLRNGSVSDTRFLVSNTQQAFVTTTTTGTFTAADLVVAELVVTTPNPSGIAGPFPTYIHAALQTNTLVNGNVFAGGGFTTGSPTNTVTLSMNGAPTWRVIVRRSSDNVIVSQTDLLANGSGVSVGNVSAGGGFTTGNPVNTITLAITANGGLNLIFLSPSLEKNTSYRIQIVMSGALTVSANNAATPLSLVANQRAIYYQCLLR